MEEWKRTTKKELANAQLHVRHSNWLALCGILRIETSVLFTACMCLKTDNLGKDREKSERQRYNEISIYAKMKCAQHLLHHSTR